MGVAYQSLRFAKAAGSCDQLLHVTSGCAGNIAGTIDDVVRSVRAAVPVSLLLLYRGSKTATGSSQDGAGRPGPLHPPPFSARAATPCRFPNSQLARHHVPARSTTPHWRLGRRGGSGGRVGGGAERKIFEDCET